MIGREKRGGENEVKRRGKKVAKTERERSRKKVIEKLTKREREREK